jgi:fused signal recognition particle receptor
VWIWIVIAVAVVLLIALAVGLVLGRRRRVSLTAPTAPAVSPTEAPPIDKPPAKGGYRAGGSISFSSGAGAATLDRPPADPIAVSGPETAPVVIEPEPIAGPVTGAEKVSIAGPPVEAADADLATEPAAPDRPAEPTVPVERAEPAAPAAEPGAPAEPAESVADEPVGTAEIVTDDAGTAAAVEAASVEETVTADEAPPVPSAPVEAAPAEETVTNAEPTPGQTAVAAEEIAPTAGRLSRLRGRLARSQTVFGRSLLGLLGAGDLDEDSWQEVEDTLLMADLGSAAALEITQTLRDQVAAHGVASAADARALLRRVLIDAVGTQADRSVRALPHDGRPAVILVVGVNGTGKTTTTGKLARVLVADGRSVVLGAADTFRAAAAEQLATWAERAGATVVRGSSGADPAAVAFDAVKQGIDATSDTVLIDTAGRLHTKTGLMDELGKVKRVVEKLAAVDEVLLVLDATTGQNGLVQARVFSDVVDVTGIVLTKLDGTAKGGIVVAVQRALGVPVKLVGLGEGPDDLAPFEPAAFVDALLGD